MQRVLTLAWRMNCRTIHAMHVGSGPPIRCTRPFHSFSWGPFRSGDAGRSRGRPGGCLDCPCQVKSRSRAGFIIVRHKTPARRVGGSELLLALTYLWSARKAYFSKDKALQQNTTTTTTSTCLTPTQTQVSSANPSRSSSSKLTSVLQRRHHPFGTRRSRKRRTSPTDGGLAAAAAALGYASRGPAPTPQSSTCPNPHAQTRQRGPSAKARSKRTSSQEWAVHGDLEPSGCPPWFA
jgi:hypothetical protein